jgi:uncharacterized protein
VSPFVILNGAPQAPFPREAPRPFHLLAGDEPLVFAVDGSRLFGVDQALFRALELGDDGAEAGFLASIGPAPRPPEVENLGRPSCLTLNVAQSCNLSCSYCYADEGRFGGHADFMSFETAAHAIDSLLLNAVGPRVTIGFMGGEPFLNRPLIHRSVAYAEERGARFRKHVGFSITTNGTLLTAADIELLRRNRFAVSVSLDGDAEVNDAMRHSRDGSSAARATLEHIRPLLEDPGLARVAARATVTHLDLNIAERVEALAAAGFRDIGVSPLRTSPLEGLAVRDSDWPALLREMIRAAEVEWSRLAAGLAPRFSNLAIALKQIHLGSARTLPCGAGANYVSVSAQGEYFTCHRTVGDARFTLGKDELDPDACSRFTTARQVDRQQPCSSCWARYLCGGGCHAEVVKSGRSGCDYIRGWLDYCLRSYDRLLRVRPEFFESVN